MENLDVILLTVVVAGAFIAFIVTTLKEFSNMEKNPYTYDKDKTTYGREALFDVLQKLFEDNPTAQKEKNALLKTIDRTISDMETDGLYFSEEVKEKLKAKLAEEIAQLPTDPTSTNPPLTSWPYYWEGRLFSHKLLLSIAPSENFYPPKRVFFYLPIARKHFFLFVFDPKIYH